jgi:hypothetical protein
MSFPLGAWSQANCQPESVRQAPVQETGATAVRDGQPVPAIAGLSIVINYNMIFNLVLLV